MHDETPSGGVKTVQKQLFWQKQHSPGETCTPIPQPNGPTLRITEHASGPLQTAAVSHVGRRCGLLAPRLRSHLRWVLERVRLDLHRVGAGDQVAVSLAAYCIQLQQLLGNVTPLAPRPNELRQHLGGDRMLNQVVRRGIEAISWVVDERGLGGGRKQDGLAWSLPLDQLWEGYVEGVVRREALVTGGEVKVGRLGETTFPVRWSDPIHRSLGHLVPDLVVRRGPFDL